MENKTPYRIFFWKPLVTDKRHYVLNTWAVWSIAISMMFFDRYVVTVPYMLPGLIFILIIEIGYVKN